MALEDLVNEQRAALAERARAGAISTYQHRARPSERSLENALASDRFTYILECDPAAPWHHFGRVDDDPQRVAEALAPQADALAVSSGPSHFEGELDRLDAVRGASDLPVVSTDVIVAPSQIPEARFHGADAVLLMLSVFDDETFEESLDIADELGVDVIAVAQDAHELDRALDHPDVIIGIDNRNFEQGQYDLERTMRLAPAVPDERRVLSIGGVDDHDQVLSLREHVDGFITGGSLTTADDIERAMRALIFGRVKVCGLTRGEDAEAAWEAGAIYGGLIFAPDSARCVDYDSALSVCASAPLDFVGVFVDHSINDIACCAKTLSLSAVQLHGHENNDYILELRRRLPDDTEIWKAKHFSAEAAAGQGLHADRILLDNFARGGKTARSVFDWSVVADLPLDERRRLILGGGLTPDNAARADRFRTWGLDVNMGVEASVGVKSPSLLDRFFSALRGRTKKPAQKLD